MNMYNAPRLIAFCGVMHSGKDTAASPFIDHGYINFKFADPLKNMLRALLRSAGLSLAEINRMIEGDLKEVISPVLCGKSPRYAMRTIGTDWGRDMIGEKIWTDALKSRVNQCEAPVVVTDMRFPNEVTCIRELGGRVIRIVRPSLPKTNDTHATEALVNGLDVDDEIENIFSSADAFKKYINERFF